MEPSSGIDLFSLSVGVLSYIFAFSLVFYLLHKFGLNQKSILTITLLSAVGHAVGAVALYEYAMSNGGDSLFYFKNANLHYQGLGYHFAFLILGYAKAYLLGESFLGAFLLSSAIAFIASVFYLLTYKILLDKISGSYPFYRFDSRQLTYPAFLLLCWPSYFFWSAGLVKDNFSFLSIGLILFIVARNKLSVSNIILFAIAAFLGFMVRAYLFIIFFVSTFIYLLLNSKWNMFLKISLISLLTIATILLLPLFDSYGLVVHFSGSTLSNIGEYAVRQQQYMNTGSSIPLPTDNPQLTFLFLPYLFLANLILPLGIGANNFIGIISSIENAYLLWWIISFIKNRAIWSDLKQKLRVANFLIIYFFFGMSCLSMMNSNLGLAMREKMMYVPALLICMFLTFAYRRILALNYYQQNELPTQFLRPVV